MRNAWLLILGHALGQSWPIRAVIYLYFLHVGSTPGQYQLAQWLMFWVLLVVEVPTGWISDRWSRKGALVAGAIFKLIGISFYALGDTVMWFIVGEQILALAKGFHSGTVQSMLQESLRREREDDPTAYRRMTAMLDIVGNAFQLVAVAAGGLIALYDIRLAAQLSAGMSVVSLVLFLLTRNTIPDNPVPEAKRTRGLGAAFRDMGTAFRIVWTNPTLRTVSLCFALVMGASQLLYQLRQPFALEAGLAKEYFGWMETAALAVMIGGGYLARRAHPKHDRVWLTLMGASLFGGMILAGLMPARTTSLFLGAIAIVCLLRGVSTFARPICDDIIQSAQVSNLRATVLSVATFQLYLIVAVGGPAVQRLIESGTSAPETLAWTGFIGGFLFFTILLTSRWFRGTGASPYA